MVRLQCFLQTSWPDARSGVVHLADQCVKIVIGRVCPPKLSGRGIVMSNLQLYVCHTCPTQRHFRVHNTNVALRRWQARAAARAASSLTGAFRTREITLSPSAPVASNHGSLFHHLQSLLRGINAFVEPSVCFEWAAVSKIGCWSSLSADEYASPTA